MARCRPQEAWDQGDVQVPDVMNEAGYDGPLWCFWSGRFGFGGSRRLFEIAAYGGSGDAPACDGEVLCDCAVAFETERGHGLGEVMDGVDVPAHWRHGLERRADGGGVGVGVGLPALDCAL